MGYMNEFFGLLIMQRIWLLTVGVFTFYMVGIWKIVQVIGVNECNFHVWVAFFKINKKKIRELKIEKIKIH